MTPVPNGATDSVRLDDFVAGERPARAAVNDRFASAAVHQEISLFLARESELMDDRSFADWVQLVTADFCYFVPVGLTPDNPYAPHYDAEAMLIDETRDSLAEQWFKRFDPDIIEIAWGDNPPVRFRHLVTNVRVRHTEDPDSYDVRSNVLLSGTRQSDASKFVAAERFDTIRRTPDGLRLAMRYAIFEETVIDFPQLRVVL
jgi:3-phenylpropionate/cinnamic acid dioxygenase small subunit